MANEKIRFALLGTLIGGLVLVFFGCNGSGDGDSTTFVPDDGNTEGALVPAVEVDSDGVVTITTTAEEEGQEEADTLTGDTDGSADSSTSDDQDVADTPEPEEDCVPAMVDVDLSDQQKRDLEDWANFNCEAQGIINNFRTRPGKCGDTELPAVEPVEFDPELGRAAMVHSADMAQWNFLSHTGSDGSSFADRVTRTGFEGQPANENVAAGYQTVEDVVDAWIGSPGHCRNLRNDALTHFGFAVAANDTADYFRYWTFVGGAK